VSQNNGSFKCIKMRGGKKKGSEPTRRYGQANEGPREPVSIKSWATERQLLTGISNPWTMNNVNRDMERYTSSTTTRKTRIHDRKNTLCRKKNPRKNRKWRNKLTWLRKCMKTQGKGLTKRAPKRIKKKKIRKKRKSFQREQIDWLEVLKGKSETGKNT